MTKVVEIGKILSGILLAIFFVFVAADVFMRNVLRVSVVWLDEGSVFAFQWMTVFAGAMCFYEGLHYRVSVLTQRMENKYKQFLDIIEIITILIFGIVLLEQGIQLTTLNLKTFSPALGLRMVWITIALPISGAAVILCVIAKSVALINKVKGASYR